MEGFENVFKKSINTFNSETKNTTMDVLFNSFRSNTNIYGFIHNKDKMPDAEAIYISLKLNSRLYKEYMTKNETKKLLGYDGLDYKNKLYDELDSRHIMMSIILFTTLEADLENVAISNIVEIGGGFGNWLRLNDGVQTFSKWNIIDLPHIGLLQDWYLKQHNIDTTKYSIISALDYKNSLDVIDLVIGSHSLSEFSWDVFYDYFTNVITKAKYFFYAYHKTSPSKDLVDVKLEMILTKFDILVNISSENTKVCNILFRARS